MRMPYARELGDMLPRWYQSRLDPPAPRNYANLKAAAIALARAPERARRNVIAAYSWAYCESSIRDYQRTSGMYLLLRVLFVLPESELSRPVHVGAGGDVINLDAPPARPVPFQLFGYSALGEYDSFSARFRMRTVAELEALIIR